MIFSTAVLILFGIEALVILICLFSEKPSIALISFAGVMLIAQFGLDFNILTPIWANVPFAAGAFAGYVVFGGAYSVLRWFARMKRTSKKLAVVEDKFQKKRDADIEKRIEVLRGEHAKQIEGYEAGYGSETPLAEFDEDAARVKAEDLISDHHYEGEHLVRRMKLSKHKTLIVGWISFWPVDILVLLFEEPVQRMWEWLSTTYERIARNALEDQGLTETYGKYLDD